MKIVGLTGGIGSGKTTVCRIFEQFGIPVFYADDEAKALYRETTVTDALAQLLGPGIRGDDGTVDRKKMAAIIFSDPEKLAQVNALIHPMVRARFDAWKAAVATAPYCIREAAILIESGAYKDCDRIIVVTAPEEERVRRVVQRDATDEQSVRDRIRSQMPESEKLKYADFVVDNSLENSLILQVKAIHHQLAGI